MMSDENRQDDQQKTSGTSRGGRRRPESGRRRFSLPFLAAAIVIVAGAAFLFNPPGGDDVPVGIGQQVSVLTAEPMVAAGRDTPRSGPVDIADESGTIVPEKAEGERATNPSPVTTQSATHESAAEESDTPPPPRTTAAASNTTQQDTGSGPAANGSWAAQYGAFGQQQNAERLMGKLRDEGHEPYLRTVNSSQGNLVYRVWIGFFETREEATAFTAANESKLGKAVVTKR